MKTEPRLVSDYLSRSYVENQNLIRFADTKANIVLALSGVILSLFFNFFVSKGSASMYQAVIVLIPFIIAGFFAFFTLYPRIGKKSDMKSLLYYRNAGNLSASQWIKLFEDGYDKKIFEDYINNTKALAEIVEKKFKCLRYSYSFFALAILIKLVIEFSVWAF